MDILYNYFIKQPSRIGVIISVLLINLAPAHADSYQLKMLFTPDANLLKAEAKGRVMIYDGLDNEMVVRALDEQFDRIENMMFIRTRYLQADGAFETDDEGCD